MDLPPPSPSPAMLCSHCHSSPSPSSPWSRYVKRKLDLEASAAAAAGDDVARVCVDAEVAALREAFEAAQEAARFMAEELEAERSAAASATTETMAMIARLQRERAEAQMESRQFRRFATEKIALDRDEIAALDGLLRDREATIQTLTTELEECRELLAGHSVQALYPSEYPALLCGDDAGDSPDEEDEGILFEIERRISQLEHEDEIKSFSDSQMPGLAAGVARDKVATVNLKSSSPPESEDEIKSISVYTVCSVQSPPVPESVVFYGNDENEEHMLKERLLEPDIEKLRARLEVLEADRESMRQSLMAIRTEKAQALLLWEIAQELARQGRAAGAQDAVSVVGRLSVVHALSFCAVLKWIFSRLFWRSKALWNRNRFRKPPGNNVGLLALLDMPPSRVSQPLRIATLLNTDMEL